MYLNIFILSSVALLIKLYSEKYREDDFEFTLTELEIDNNLPKIRIYDFIIDGGGGTGCVIANRLSKYYDVLLLEAGGTPPPATEVPFFTINVRDHPSINYQYRSIPQLHTGLESAGIIIQTEGKMLGGSTSHNLFLYNRGHPLDYDNWANITNDQSWEYKNILKYFKKSENYIGKKLKPDEVGQHGYLGLMTVDTVDTPILSTWLDAGAELGFRTAIDPNGPQTEGFSALAVTLKNGHRVSTYTAYIEPIEKIRKTLRIERYSQVSKVLINKYKRAYGVFYKRHQIPQIVHASKEVIVSSGSFGTPLLLMKSGIGPKKELKNAGIQQVIDLRVGSEICDHLALRSLPIAFGDSPWFFFQNIEINEDSIKEYHKNGKGALGEPTVLVQALVVSSKAKILGQPNWPNLIINIYKSYKVDTDMKTPFSYLWVGLQRSKCKGVEDNEKLAVIDYNYLSDPTDVDTMVEGIKFALNIIENTIAFRKLGARLVEESHPNCLKFPFRSDTYWKCYIYQVTSTSWHTSSSCKMGYGQNDKSAVLDSRLNVIWVSNLNVVDASIMPVVTNTNTAAPVIMIAEKASAEILKYWKFYVSNKNKNK